MHIHIYMLCIYIYMLLYLFLNPKSEIAIALGIKKYKNNLCNDVKLKWHIRSILVTFLFLYTLY